jgi:hypothetical protein
MLSTFATLILFAVPVVTVLFFVGAIGQYKDDREDPSGWLLGIGLVVLLLITASCKGPTL